MKLKPRKLRIEMVPEDLSRRVRGDRDRLIKMFAEKYHWLPDQVDQLTYYDVQVLLGKTTDEGLVTEPAG